MYIYSEILERKIHGIKLTTSHTIHAVSQVYEQNIALDDVGHVKYTRLNRTTWKGRYWNCGFTSGHYRSVNVLIRLRDENIALESLLAPCT